jgi:hypothetical protein
VLLGVQGALVPGALVPGFSFLGSRSWVLVPGVRVLGVASLPYKKVQVLTKILRNRTL